MCSITNTAATHPSTVSHPVHTPCLSFLSRKHRSEHHCVFILQARIGIQQLKCRIVGACGTFCSTHMHHRTGQALVYSQSSENTIHVLSLGGDISGVRVYIGGKHFRFRHELARPGWRLTILGRRSNNYVETSMYERNGFPITAQWYLC